MFWGDWILILSKILRKNWQIGIILVVYISSRLSAAIFLVPLTPITTSSILFLHFMTHPEVVNSLSIDRQVGTLYNHPHGTNGIKAAMFFGNLAKQLGDDWFAKKHYCQPNSIFNDACGLKFQPW